MKVLIVNAVLYTSEQKKVKDVETIKNCMIYDLCLSFLNKGHDVTLAASDQYKPIKEETYPFKIIWMKTRFEKIFPANKIPCNTELLKILKNNDYDLIISSEVFQLNTLFCVLRSKKNLVIWQEMAFHQKMLKQLASKFWHNVIVKLFYKNVLIVPRSTQAQKFISQYSNSVSHTLIEHGVNTDKFKFNDKKENYFVVSSQLIERKHIDKIIEKFANFIINYNKNYTLYIIGSGDKKEYLEEYAKKLKIEKKVIFLGRLNHDELINYLNKAKAMLVYTEKDNSMLSITESIAVGTPVITTTIPNNAYEIQKYKLGIAKDNWTELELNEICLNNVEYINNCKNYISHIDNKNNVDLFFKILNCEEKKIKLGFLTRHSVGNYGSLFQTYATQHFFSNLGYENEIINYERIDEKGTKIAQTMLKNNNSWNRSLMRKILYLIIQTPLYYIPYRKFKKFRKKLLQESKREYNNLDDFKNHYPNYDCVFTGSDQVWGKIGTDKYDPIYFLDFLKENSKCFSFASSFGSEAINDELDKALPDLVKKYSFITVREQSAVKILKSKNIDSHLVLDPTLLINKDEWYRMANQKVNEKRYILVYQLHNDENIDKYIQLLSQKTDKKIVRIANSVIKKKKNEKIVLLPNPNLFLSYFRNADYIITDSFHATVFAIVFNKQFFNIMPDNTGTRIKNLHELLDIRNRVIIDVDTLNNALNDKINYDTVNKNLDCIKNNSIRNIKKMVGDLIEKK